jgi:hypothetical protein
MGCRLAAGTAIYNINGQDNQKWDITQDPDTLVTTIVSVFNQKCWDNYEAKAGQTLNQCGCVTGSGYNKRFYLSFRVMWQIVEELSARRCVAISCLTRATSNGCFSYPAWCLLVGIGVTSTVTKMNTVAMISMMSTMMIM